MLAEAPVLLLSAQSTCIRMPAARCPTMDGWMDGWHTLWHKPRSRRCVDACMHARVQAQGKRGCMPALQAPRSMLAPPPDLTQPSLHHAGARARAGFGDGDILYLCERVHALTRACLRELPALWRPRTHTRSWRRHWPGPRWSHAVTIFWMHVHAPSDCYVVVPIALIICHCVFFCLMLYVIG